jgi:hypothetical protein
MIMKKITFYQNKVEILLSKKDIDRFVSLGLLSETGDKYYSTISDIYFKPVIENADVELWIDDWRKIFHGKKPGSMGNKEACLKKMQHFMLQYPDYDKDLIFKAAEAYINSFTGDTRFFQQADYFIYKQDPGMKGINNSRLATFCEDIKQGGAYAGFENLFEDDI